MLLVMNFFQKAQSSSSESESDESESESSSASESEKKDDKKDAKVTKSSIIAIKKLLNFSSRQPKMQKMNR